MKKRNKSGNPFFISYLGLAMLCCILLSVLFLSINLENTKRQERLHMEEKLCLIAEDMERQFQSFQKINRLISVNQLYQPFYFTRNKYYEMTLLNDFTQYQNYSPMLSAYFLYYQNYDTMFYSDETTTNLATYLSGRDVPDPMELTRLLNHAETTCFYYSPQALYVLMPVSSIHSGAFPGAVLCMVIDTEALRQRFWTVSGGLEGVLCLSADNQLLYTGLSSKKSADASAAEAPQQAQEQNAEPSPASVQEKEWVSYRVPGGVFTVSLLPSEKGLLPSILLPLQVLLVIAVIILVLLLASLFARRTYQPLLTLTQKYQKTLPPLSPDIPAGSKLDELNYMMESVLKKNMAANEKLDEYQELLRSQLLILLLNGNCSFDLSPYLSQVNLHFPGPCYFVICTIFSGQEHTWPEFCLEMIKLYDSLSEPEEEIFIYSVAHTERPILSSLISIPDSSQREALYRDFMGLFEGMSPLPQIGCGNVYHDFPHLSASYLEALDNAGTAKPSAPRSDSEGISFQIRPSDLYPVISALSMGKESAALEAMASYLSDMEQAMPSLLMQQYRFTNILNELMRLFEECQIEVSKQSISLMLSAKNPAQFSSAASLAIHEFCTKFQEQKTRFSQDLSYQIVQYVNEHFTDYELSLDRVANQFQTTAAVVRSAIREHTGSYYKDYLIGLRMEYAKKLLARDRLTVAETCQKVGYTNISYFIKAFKNQTGLTPANYKNRLWESDSASTRSLL